MQDASLIEVRAQDQPLQDLFRGTEFEAQVPALTKAKILTAVDLLTRGSELNNLLKSLSYEQLRRLKTLAGRLFMPVMDTPITLPQLAPLPWGCEVLDPLWGGGVPRNGIVKALFVFPPFFFFFFSFS
jgi:hypothetical protein